MVGGKGKWKARADVAQSEGLEGVVRKVQETKRK